ncbi:hypothetical protein [uncultured Algimonas sp.]|uniref:hypothetical protein n=1 Tax=uncultured Algimonas sp. TaxID=1547920 RepID=UPI002616A4E2|nr:hypothetical protein [uncultured Algimonas sp.]
MTGTQHLQGPGAGLFGQIGRWLTLAIMSVAAAFMLFFSAAFALFLVGAVLVLAIVAVSIFWIRAKLTGRPFGPKARMDAHMAELRRQMGVDMRDEPRPADGPVIDAHETPEGWTVER